MRTILVVAAALYFGWAIGGCYWWSLTAGRNWWPLRRWGWRGHVAAWLWCFGGELWMICRIRERRIARD